MNSRLSGLAMVTVVLLGCNSEPTGPETREVKIFIGPRFWTGDPGKPWAAALLVSEGRIVRTIESSEVARNIAGGGELVQLPGQVAVPGLVDAHAHLTNLAMLRRQVQLDGTKSLDEVLERVAAFARAHPGDGWIRGRGWDQNDWPDRGWPDADRLEQIVPGRPIVLERVDGHAYWVNRTALAAAKIDGQTADPRGGSIVRDAGKRPIGILVDNAMDLVDAIVPKPTVAELSAALDQLAPELLAAGLTGIHDMGLTEADRQAIGALAERNRFPLRVYAYAWDKDPLAQTLLNGGPIREGRLEIRGVKLYADGALGSRGARLLAPYSDQPDTAGLSVTAPEELERRIAAEAARGLQPAIHAIGDAANRAVLDAIAQAEIANGALKQLRPRLEHAQILAPEDIPRLAPLGVIASMQPTHATSDMPWAIERLGAARLQGAYAWRSMLNAGAALAFGSDFPVESPDPRLGLYAATTRTDRSGNPEGGWYPDQKLSIEETVTAFTHGAAYAVSHENELGRLAPGYWCDITVFDRDIFAIEPSALLDTTVTATVIGGQSWPLRRASPR